MNERYTPFAGKPIFFMTARGKLRIKRSASGLIFCSKFCQGQYMGNHVGFKVHPEHGNRKRRPSKYAPLIAEFIMRLKTGETLNSILTSHGISRGNHALIKYLIENYSQKGGDA